MHKKPLLYSIAVYLLTLFTLISPITPIVSTVIALEVDEQASSTEPAQTQVQQTATQVAKGVSTLQETGVADVKLNYFREGTIGSKTSDIIQVGREDTFTMVVEAENKGNGTAHNALIVANFREFHTLDLHHRIYIESYKVLLNGDEITDDLTIEEKPNWIYLISDFDLNPEDKLRIEFKVRTETFIPYGIEYLLDVDFYARDNENEETNTNGNGQNNDDAEYSINLEKKAVITKIDNIAPKGKVYFQIDGQTIIATNQDEVTVVYEGTDTAENDIHTRIVGARFSNDSNDWYTLDSLEKLKNNETKVLEVDGQWNAWPLDTDKVTEQFVMEEEGYFVKYLLLVDLYGNIYLAQAKIIKDTTPPNKVGTIISPFKLDMSNPTYTGSFTNYTNFEAFDDEGVYPSGIGSYQYSFDNQTWTNWASMEEGLKSLQLTFPEVEPEQELIIYMKFKDIAGNLYVNEAPLNDPKTGNALDVTVVYDTIIYTNEQAEVSLKLNNDDAYTKNPLVNLNLTIDDTRAGVYRIRTAASEAELMGTDWMSYDVNEEEHRALPGSDNTGVKTLCVQLMDRALNVSNVACDSISLDFEAPQGIFTINGGDTETADRNVTLGILASEALADGSAGVGEVKMKFSTSGENCEYIVNATLKAECETKWTEWEDYTYTKAWTLDDYLGEHTLYLQLKDKLNNFSEVIKATIVYDPYQGTGGININNGDLFTNTKYGRLYLNVEELNCNGCNPVLMRFYTTSDDEVPHTAPDTKNMDEYNQYLQSTGSAKSGYGSWTYWQEFYTPVQWNLDALSTTIPDYGKKNVFVQFKLPNTEEIGPYSDSIIYAPYYGIKYSSVADTNSTLQDLLAASGQTPVYSLSNVPTNVLTQEEFILKVNGDNFGSFTWPSEGENPVRITYKWIRNGGELPAGWTEEMVIKELRGNSAILPNNVAWNQETGMLDLKVNTPIIPGDYSLIIDAVHEGVTWFGAWGNETPTFSITIDENPAKPTPVPEFDLGAILGDEAGIGGEVPVPYDWEADGWGANCEDTWNSNNYSGRLCYIQGTWTVSRDTGYHEICEAINGGYYEYEMTTSQGRTFFFCPGDTEYWDQFLDKQMISKVQWFTWRTGFQIIETRPARLTWNSQFHSQHNDPKLFSTIAVNRSSAEDGRVVKFQIQPKFYNAGSTVWTWSNIELVAIDKPLDQGGIEKPSIFYDSGSWSTPSRLKVNVNHSGYGYNTLAPFTFNIYVPETANFGLTRQCFVMTNNPYETWERRDSFCLNIDIQMTYEEKREYFCPQPHAVYVDKDESSEIIGYIQQNTEFIIKYTDGDWSNIYYPTTGQKGWIINNLECFGEAEVIENIIPVPEFEVTPQPVGNDGYVIFLDGIDVKRGPAESFDTIAFLPYGTKVEVLGEAHMEDYKYGGWLLVRIPPENCITQEAKDLNCEGWVPKGTIHHVNDPRDIEIVMRPMFSRGHVCADSPINVYMYPGIRTIVLGTLEPGQNVSIIREWNGWFQVYMNEQGDTGWIDSLGGLCEGYEWPSGSVMCAGKLGYPYEQEWPVTTEYGTMRSTGPHNAIDIAASYGTPVLAVEYGIVKFVGRDGYCPTNIHGSGLYVDIYHPKQNVTSRYLHLSSTAVGLDVNDEVFQGMIIGKTGNTGCVDPWPTYESPLRGTHLHFAIKDYNYGGAWTNPEQYWTGGTCTVDEEGNLEWEDEITNYADYTDDDIAEQVMDELDWDPTKLMVNWNMDETLFPSGSGFHLVDEEYYDEESGETIKFRIPEVRTGKKDEYFGYLTVMNPTTTSYNVRSDLQFLSNPQHAIYKNFYLEDTETGQKYYYNDYSEAPSWFAHGAGEVFIDLKSDLTIGGDQIFRTFYMRGTLKRLNETLILFGDGPYPLKGEYFAWEWWLSSNFDGDNSDRYYQFKIGDHSNEEPDLEYSFDADTFWNDLLPTTTCVLGSIVFSAGTALALCIALPTAKIISQGYVGVDDAINIGSELLFFGAGKIIKVGYRAIKGPIAKSTSKLVTHGLDKTIAKKTSIEITEKVAERELAKKGGGIVFKEMIEEGTQGLMKQVGSEAMETGTTNVGEQFVKGIAREGSERSARRIAFKPTTVLRPVASDVNNPMWKKIMGKTYSVWDKIPKTPKLKLQKGIIFDGLQDGVAYEMKNYTGKVGLTYQLRMEIFQAWKDPAIKKLVFVTPNGLDSMSSPLRKLIEEVNQESNEKGFQIVVEKFISAQP